MFVIAAKKLSFFLQTQVNKSVRLFIKHPETLTGNKHIWGVYVWWGWVVQE